MDVLDPNWSAAVVAHVADLLDEPPSTAHCTDPALAAARILREQRSPRRGRAGIGGFLLELIGGPSPEEMLAAAIAETLPLGDSRSAIARRAGTSIVGYRCLPETPADRRNSVPASPTRRHPNEPSLGADRRIERQAASGSHGTMSGRDGGNP